jgi:hypothetical protein
MVKKAFSCLVLLLRLIFDNGENLKGLSSEIGWAESGIIRKLSFKGRGAGIFNWFLPSPLL